MKKHDIKEISTHNAWTVHGCNNFVSIRIGSSDEIDVSIDDFLHALNMFKEIRAANAERNSWYESRELP